MCKYCGETFQDSKHKEMYEGHYPLIENIPVHLMYLSSVIDTSFNEHKKLNFSKDLQDIVGEFNLTPDMSLSFIEKEKLKSRLENLVFSIYSENMCAWESIVVQYFTKGI